MSLFFCLVDKFRGISNTIGLQEYAYWINMNGKNDVIPEIVYPSPSNNQRLRVQLICNRSSSSHHLEVLGESVAGEYIMRLISRCACWNGCRNPSPHPFHFHSKFWVTTGIAVGAVSLVFIMTITCLFCSKPKRRYRTVIINEKTPIIQDAMDYHL